ncbi:MAG: terpene cyclase/mutase family protein [Planctomycetaceae bacterium]|nr:terpene cyclase/mutase family protein [Planctomycetaceae bacterium]
MLFAGVLPCSAQISRKDPKITKATSRALDWLARQQKHGYWEANGGQYRVAMTALSGMAMLSEGSTTTRGKYADNIERAVDFLIEMSQPNGLIGYSQDYHYTYGHGFSMLFLSQVYGEEEDIGRRKELRRVLTAAVKFAAGAQTSAGGWGYVSAKDGNDFDEGSTCITQVQGLRACRNAGIPVEKEIIERAKAYIEKCMTPDGGIQYSLKSGGGSRPPITAAALAAMNNAGEYETEMTKKMMKYCKANVWPAEGHSLHGHWHYTHLYYSQVMYRQEEDEYRKYFNDISEDILRKQSADGSWKEGHVGPVYTTALNVTILLMDNGYLPIYQR